jgi:hypothetical protein
MTVVYSPRFKSQYDQLPPTSQAQFRLIDAEVKKGNMAVLRQNAWVYYCGVGGGFLAWGTKQDDEFYWRAVDVPAMVPIIL